MPGLKDLAALPTSWALTLWDALPIILSVEAALVVVVLGTLSGRAKASGWLMSGSNIVGGFAYLILFGSDLAICFAPCGIASLLIVSRRPKPTLTPDTPGSPFEGLTSRVWSVVGAVAVSAGLAAAIKIS